MGAVASKGASGRSTWAGPPGRTFAKATCFARSTPPDDVLRLAGRFIQYYRENAKYLERTYAFVPRIGIEKFAP